MAKVDLDHLLDRCGSVYKLVLLASKRAKELADGSKRLIETDTRKVTSVVLEEIEAGKVRINESVKPEKEKQEKADE